jgi:hypothetical protein
MRERPPIIECDESPEQTAEELAEELANNPDYQREKMRFEAFRRMDWTSADDECKMRRERGPNNEWISGHEIFLAERGRKK